MKSILLFLITIYQTVLSPVLKQLLGVKYQCRYPVTCSAYAKNAIKKHGTLKGFSLAMRRLVHCQPFAKDYGYN